MTNKKNFYKFTKLFLKIKKNFKKFSSQNSLKKKNNFNLNVIIVVLPFILFCNDIILCIPDETLSPEVKQHILFLESELSFYARQIALYKLKYGFFHNYQSFFISNLSNLTPSNTMYVPLLKVGHNLLCFIKPYYRECRIYHLHVQNLIQRCTIENIIIEPSMLRPSFQPIPDIFLPLFIAVEKTNPLLIGSQNLDEISTEKIMFINNNKDVIVQDLCNIGTANNAEIFIPLYNKYQNNNFSFYRNGEPVMSDLSLIRNPIPENPDISQLVTGETTLNTIINNVDIFL